MYSRIDFSGKTDEEVCLRIKDGHTEGIDYLLNKYKGIVRKKAHSFYLMGGDRDDLIQEGMIGLMRAVHTFDPEREKSFAAFAELCISRQIYSAVRASQRKKHQPLNSYVSLYQQEDDDENAPALVDILAQTDQGPEDSYFLKESNLHLLTELRGVLSPLERKVLDLFMDGMGYAQIAEQLNKDEKSVDNALQRIRGKAYKLTHISPGDS